MSRRTHENQEERDAERVDAPLREFEERELRLLDAQAAETRPLGEQPPLDGERERGGRVDLSGDTCGRRGSGRRRRRNRRRGRKRRGLPVARLKECIGGGGGGERGTGTLAVAHLCAAREAREFEERARQQFGLLRAQ